MAGRYGFMFMANQVGRQGATIATKHSKVYTMPDVILWTCPGQHHEIKHKSPTRTGLYGLECYRFRALVDFANETQQAVFYTIHDHEKAGGRDIKINRLSDWVSADVRALDGQWSIHDPNGTSWVNGQRKENVSIYYWPVCLWIPLSRLWGL